MDLAREVSQAPDITSRMERAGVGYLRVAAIGAKTADLAKSRAAELVKGGASTLLVDVRRTSGGTPDNGLALARGKNAGRPVALSIVAAGKILVEPEK
jgi:C-terminal processing protease CtpA/Prc